MILDAALFFALAAALSFGVADLAMRYGVQNAHPFLGAAISRLVSLLALFAGVLVVGGKFPPLGMHYVWVAAGGICVPGLFSVLFMFGTLRIGVSRAAPIKGCSPIFSSFLALLILGERPGWYNLAGVFLVAGGIALISSGRTEGRWRRIHALWPISAAAAAGLGAVLWRAGLRSFPDILTGATVGTGAAFVVTLAVTALVIPGQMREGARRSWKAFSLVGLAAALGNFFYAGAFQRGEVYRMASIIQLSPLVTVLLALFLLRRAEEITWRVPAGAVATVAGAILVSLRW